MATFTFTHHRNRYGDQHTIEMAKTAKGWHLDAVAYTGDMHPDGRPLLYGHFDQDMVAYPAKMDSFLEHAWRQLDTGEWSEAQAQIRLQELADWVSSCEAAEPKWPDWN